MDRERSNQLLPLPSPRQAGEKEYSLVSIMSVPIWGRRLRQGIPDRSIPLASSNLHLLAPQHPSPPLLSHLSYNSHTELARVQAHSKDAAPSIHCLHNNPVTPTLPTAERGRLCIKGSVLKREEYFPRKNQHPQKTKVLKAQTGELIGAGYRRNWEIPVRLQQSGSQAT